MTDSERRALDLPDDEAARLVRLAGPRPPVPPDAESRVHAAVREHWFQRTAASRQRRRLGWTLGLAAAAVVILAVAVVRLLPSAAERIATIEVVHGHVEVVADGSAVAASSGLPLAAGVTVVTGSGGRLAARLVGGTSLRVDETSRATFEGADRVRLESGAIYLDSGGAASGPGMVVATPLGEVRDVGTQFEVRLRGDSLRVSVRDGLVRLSRADGEADVPAGQRLVVAPDGSSTYGAIASYDPMWSWVLAIAPRFQLEGATVAELLAWTTRETGLAVHWGPEVDRTAVERIVLHGSLARLRPDEAPAAVLATCGLAARVEEGALIVDASAP